MRYILILCLFILTPSLVQAAEPIKKGTGGVYIQQAPSNIGDMFYQVDTNTHQCFAIWYWGTGNRDVGGITSISCHDLANDPEWASILTWVNEKKK